MARNPGEHAASLLSRIRSPRSRDGGAAPSDRALRDSILEHLRAMCSTRLGSMLVRPDYGLPSVSEMVHSFPDAASALARALLHTIEKYEPRLTQVKVRHVPSAPSDLMVRFEVTAMLSGSDEATPLRFETRIDSSRRVSVT